jgi:tetratricopeptide (TPR) repeat protein
MTDVPSDPLESALNQYAQALTVLEQDRSTALPYDILAALVARDHVQACLTDPAYRVTASTLIQLDELDQRLRQQDKAIAAVDKLTDWQTLRHPPETAWWWFPKVIYPTPWWDQFDGLCNVTALAFITAAIALILNTSSRFFIGGADAWGSLAIVGQSVLVLITGGSLTEKGRELLERTFTGLKISKHYWQEINAVLAFLLLLGILGFRATLPLIASGFNQNGLNDYQAGRLDSALSNYQQAIALHSDYTEAHYNLGVLYENLQKLDQAIAEYELVVQSDPNSEATSQARLTLLRANNNLGRLYLLKGKNLEAWTPLERGMSLVGTDAAKTDPNFEYEQYKLLKNMGWVRFQQKQYVDAQRWLKQAIALQPAIEPLLKQDGGRAAPFCLEAQILEAQKQNSDADWTECLRYAQLNNPDEAQWIGLARERLTNP